MSQYTDNIKKHLISQLHYTPRRLLFEEFHEKVEKIREQQIFDSKSTQADFQHSETYDLKFLHQINEFRVQNARDCMSELNFRRRQRENKKLENFLKHSCVHRFRLNDRLIPVPVKSNELGQSLCIICSKAAEGEQCTAGNSMIINESKFDGERLEGSKGKEFYMLEGCQQSIGFEQSKMRTKGYENSYALKYQNFKYQV